MKNVTTGIIMILFASLLFGCQQEEMSDLLLASTVKMKTVTVSAGISDTDTKASLDSSTGAFTWQNGDIISVLATDGKFYDFILEGESGRKEAEFVGQIPEDAHITTVATYPRMVTDGTENTILTDNTLNYVLPSSWTWTENVSNVPMVATFGEGGAEYMSFKQVGGVMRFPVKNLPDEATFIVTMHDKTISGQFPVDITALGKSCMFAGSTASEVVINYSSDTDGAYAEFNLPVPTGTYNNFTVTIKDSEGDRILIKNYSADNKVGRATLLNMKELVPISDKPKFTSLSLSGVQASELDSKYISVRFPYGTDVSSLVMDYTVSDGVLYADGIEISPNTAMNFTSPVKFTIITNNGAEVDYFVSVSFSDIPVVYIKTQNAAPIESKEIWLEGTEIYITNAGDDSQLYVNAQIRGRGNSTWECPKKPYAIKLDSKEKVLGMPKHKRWVLLANYFDKSCLRNSIAFEIGRRSSGLDWTPRGYHVDVVLNGVMLGNYYLCEQIKIDKNRVNTDNGYLLELDKHFDEVNKFHSPIRNMPFMIKEPDEDELTPERFEFIQNHVSDIETALYSVGSTTEGYMQYIDLDSFIDYWLVYELTSTGEPTHPKSVYMYLNDDGKMYAGPVWDFDYFTYQPYYNTMLINTNAVWNDRIINDPNNAAKILERWNQSREDYKDIENEILRQYELIKESAEYNAKIWSPLTREPNKEENMSVEEIVSKIHGFYKAHFDYMDSMYKY